MVEVDTETSGAAALSLLILAVLEFCINDCTCSHKTEETHLTVAHKALSLMNDLE